MATKIQKKLSWGFCESKKDGFSDETLRHSLIWLFFHPRAAKNIWNFQMASFSIGENSVLMGVTQKLRKVRFFMQESGALKISVWEGGKCFILEVTWCSHHKSCCRTALFDSFGFGMDVACLHCNIVKKKIIGKVGVKSFPHWDQCAAAATNVVEKSRKTFGGQDWQ